MINKMKLLQLNVSREPFEVMVTGEKQIEFRKFSKWIYSRIYDEVNNCFRKDYDGVKITHGYGKNRPYFIAYLYDIENICHCVCCNEINTTHKYSNELKVREMDYDYRILLGEIIETGNIRKK